MTKLKDIIKISSGYTSYVDLIEDYFNEDKRRGRMEMYMPITAHRLAFEKIANAVTPKDRRFYFLSGSYGTGKSHLCLMLANYFAHQSDLPELAAFFRNYEEAQENVKLPPGKTLEDVTGEKKKPQNLKNLRKQGRFLVAICRFGLNLEFEGNVLKAIQEAIQRDGAGLELKTHFKEAVRKLDDWRQNASHLLKPFEETLENEYPGWSISRLEEQLESFDEEAYRVFKNCFKKATSTDFSYDYSNLINIVKEIVNDPAFKERFKGLVIIYDEFGYALDDKLVKLSLLQEFAQFCANSGLQHLPVVFIGTGHKSFKDHGDVGDKVHYSTITARVEEVALRTEGMEDIIGAIVQPQKSSEEWKREVGPNSQVFAYFARECNRLKLFDWLPAPVLKRKILENIFPMHPMATFALLELAKDVGSDNRSIFKFFASEFDEDKAQKYSYVWFIMRNEILKNQGLNLYTVDLLYDYFEDGLQGSNVRLESIKSTVADYNKAVRDLNKYIQKEEEGKLMDSIDEGLSRILKAMLVHEVVSNDQVTILNTLENLAFSLDMSTETEKKQLKNWLDRLSQKGVGVLYKNDKVFEFRRSDSVDMYRLIEAYMGNPSNRPNDILDAFMSLYSFSEGEQFFEAKDYNLTYSEDKRLKVNFVTLSELKQEYEINGSKIDLFSKLEQERKATPFGQNYYEGNAVIVYCDTEDKVEEAKQFLKKNKHPRVAVAVPRKPVDFFNAVFKSLAIKNIGNDKANPDYKNYSSQEIAQLNKLKIGAEETLKDLKNRYFSNKELQWFGAGGKSLPTKEDKVYDVANLIMEDALEGRRTKIPHNYLNKAHIRISGTTQRVFEEAGNILANLKESVKIDHSWADNRGGINYLKRCFVDNAQVLSLLDSSGDIRFYEVEKDMAKFKGKFPAYANMLESIPKLPNGKATLANFLNTYYEDYGLGDISITLALLLARRYFGDSIRFKREETAIVDVNINQAEDILRLLDDHHSNAILLYEEISEEDKAYFSKVHQIFSTEPSQAGKDYSISEAFEAVRSWWTKQPRIVKSNAFYEKPYQEIVETFNLIESESPYTFVKSAILKVFNVESSEKISSSKLKEIAKGLQVFKAECEQKLEEKQSNIVAGFQKIFDAEGDTTEHVKDAILAWYDSLDSLQQDKYSRFHSTQSKALIENCKTNISRIDFMLFEKLPEDLGFGAVKDWVKEHETDYLGAVTKTKGIIDQNKIRVSEPVIQFLGDTDDGNKDGELKYKGELTIEIAPGKPNEVVYLTDDGSNPSKAESNRMKITDKEEIKVEGGNRTIKFVACDNEGNFGQIKTLSLYDVYQESKVFGEPDVFGEIKINFVFPKDANGLKKSLKSFLETAKKHNVANDEQIRQILKDLSEE
ncbi:MAG: chitobiase/beta-hexosaminidase C-terminal domain-containing protein [Halobacteriovoraceae bacterium]|nr:chitobiase/beta-hexosaminidase C-terminal domain-containing protein [Halobacteriovoraceae bacterium]